MIRRVSIRNFKCLRDVDITLERFTVFVGPNASGKSSILQALDLLCKAFSTEPVYEVKGEIRQNLTRGVTDQVELIAYVDHKGYRYHGGQGLQVTSYPELSGGNGWQPWQGRGQMERAPANLTLPPRTILLRLESSKLALPTPAQPDPTVMAPDGTGLHSSLANIALSDPESWQQIQDHLRQIVPTVRRLRHTMKGPNNSPALLFDMHGADSLSASQVSEGTLLVLGLLTALHAPGRPNLLLLDDLDRGLHPKAQRELIGLLRSILGTNPDIQIVASTHSPYMLDRFEPNEVRMTYLREDGYTASEPLTRHPKFDTWKDEFHPGELWGFFGEKWVAEPEVAAQ